MATADLRPMALGEVLDRTFSLYKNHFWLFAGIMTLPYLILFIFQVVSSLIQFASTQQGTHPSATATAATAPSGGMIAGVIGVALVFLVIYFALTAAAQAATIFAVSDLYLGRPATVRGSFRRVRGKILTVLGVTLLTGLIVGLGAILLFIPGIILLCRTAVGVPAAMLEDQTPMSAIRRSMDLTKGHAMQIFLIIILVLVSSWIVAAIFQFPFLFLAGAFSKPHALPIGVAILQHLASFVSGVLVGPVGTIAFSLMYYNLRVRKEGFDLQHLMASLGPSSAPGTQLPSPAAPA